MRFLTTGRAVLLEVVWPSSTTYACGVLGISIGLLVLGAYLGNLLMPDASHATRNILFLGLGAKSYGTAVSALKFFFSAGTWTQIAASGVWWGICLLAGILNDAYTFLP